MTGPATLKVLIASSLEARDTARDLRLRLPQAWETVLWDEDVMTPGQAPWSGLLQRGALVDAAVLLLTGDDVLIHRDAEHRVPRDNVIFEAGLFMGLLGPERALLVHDADTTLKLPSDLEGITKIRIRRPVDGLGALDVAAREIERSLARLGRRHGDVPPTGDATRSLELEIERLGRAAQARGWRVERQDGSTVRFHYAGSRPIELRIAMDEPDAARKELRAVALVLHKLGVRVAQDLLPRPTRR